ncbi:oxidoreductase [Xylaria grammica]|nr:oxidoreductase [Xylaria grammica]
MSAESFDFIIVGGGTAGIALASRLSEAAHQTVLVLEAGVDYSDDPRVKIPSFYMALFGTGLDWGFKTVTQPKLNGRSISLSQGKCLGGSSVMNAHVYAPPTKAILDAWAELGNVGWNWDTMAPYYTKAFTSPQTPHELRKSLGMGNWGPDDMNARGPVQLSYPGSPSHSIHKIWAETFDRKGYGMASNPWVDASVGAFSNFASIDPVKRERCHAAKAYYSSIQDRENLHVILNASVNKILFADDVQPQPQAVGVQYEYEGKTKIANARKEIIICAGALQSPKLLELSGIGNADILKRHNIGVIKDLPGVGENLQDHPVCDITFAAVDEMDTLDALARQEPKALEQAMIDFTQNHDGPLTTGGIQTYAYLPIMELGKSGREQLVKLLDENRPTISPKPNLVNTPMYYEIAEKTLLDPTKPSGAYLSVISQNVIAADPETGKPAPPQPGNHLTLVTILAQPLSRGTVHIVSGDATAAPEIDPKYLSHPLDMEVFAHHVMYLRTLASSAPLSEAIKQPLQPSTPLAHIADLDAAKRYIAARTISMWHPAGTCAMLPERIGGVVDASLRVHGVRNLRVVDASVVPLLPPGNLQSTVYAVAERAADLIKDAHKL